MPGGGRPPPLPDPLDNTVRPTHAHQGGRGPARLEARTVSGGCLRVQVTLRQRMCGSGTRDIGQEGLGTGDWGLENGECTWRVRDVFRGER
jgi:hypothetical protein